jgi:hypothetical protein
MRGAWRKREAEVVFASFGSEKNWPSIREANS